MAKKTHACKTKRKTPGQQLNDTVTRVYDHLELLKRLKLQKVPSVVANINLNDCELPE